MWEKFITFSTGRVLIFLCGLTVVLSSRIPSIAASESQIQISEIMAAAHYAIADEDGEYSDWIELRNNGGASVNLLGWRLTDNEAEPGKWVFPAVEIAPGGYLVVFASGKDRAVPGNTLHTNFNLDQDGEYLALVRPGGTIEDKLVEGAE
ncbi:MAG: lamin tail domain-containing protein, partial [Verrucomicrobiaceae bacterium]